MRNSLTDRAVAILATADPAAKCAATKMLAADWFAGRVAEIGDAAPPERPARPPRPELLPPNRMPKRSYGGAEGRKGLLHALAHIEFNAIDLAWDVIARFRNVGLPKGFFDDWVQVALDEAEHFEALEVLLAGLGASYGDLPAHDGLWEAATKTAHDARARLAVVPMVLEARGLDTTPATMEKLARNGDHDTVRALDVIYHDEIRHVAAGTRWFVWLCERAGDEPKATWHRYLAQYFIRGVLKPPFNVAARNEAGLPEDWYRDYA